MFEYISMNFTEWKAANPHLCVGPGVNYAWNRYMDSLAPRWPPGYSESVTRITPVPAGTADTSLNGGQYRTPKEDRQMFTTNTFETRFTALVSAMTLAALVASLVA